MRESFSPVCPSFGQGSHIFAFALHPPSIPIINATDNTFLNFKSESPSGWGYAVFGKVVSGQDVVDAIEGTKTGRKGGHDDVPLEDVVIQRAVVL